MPHPSREAVRAWRELMHVHAAITSAIDETLRLEIGIPGSWYEALVEIAFAGGTMRMSDFARETTLTKSGATRFVDRLENAGLVERISCPTDRRAYNLSLTAEGRRLQQAADPYVLGIIRDRFGRHMSGDEASTIRNLLSRTRPEMAST
ncbi:MAG TPA: MarR family transcriptional regulator [Acidimicrobiia bacterium]|nr:MarR family transcriptional regulator [Acidimicrobiia bacterium]